MDEYLQKNNETVKNALRVMSEIRSYDDILLLKAWLMRTEFMSKNLAGIANPHQMNEICRHLELVEYQAGDVVFNQGDMGNKVYILYSGSCDLRVRYKIDLTKGQSEIREKLVLTYDTLGQFFGERALQFDEPRSGSVLCREQTLLVAVSKASYLAVLNEAKNNPEWKDKPNALAPLSTKETVIEVFSKMRHQRTNAELDAVASYLIGRIPFFAKFSMQQLVELCRLCETLTVKERKVLFKQGQIGQAFYVILTGTVEVWVRNTNSSSPAAAVVSPLGRGRKVTAGLGVKVSQLVSGETFGERALESEDSTRMASIVTGEGETVMIVIAREDYYNFVYVMMQTDTMCRLSLLRKTELFRSVDVMHLKVLAKFMRPKQYQLKETLYRAGTKAVEIIIIESGECSVETEVRVGIDIAEQARRHRIRPAPHYMQPTLFKDGQYHEGEDGVTPFHEDPYHKHHPELGHQHPTDAEILQKERELTPPRRKSPLPSSSRGDSKSPSRSPRPASNATGQVAQRTNRFTPTNVVATAAKVAVAKALSSNGIDGEEEERGGGGGGGVNTDEDAVADGQLTIDTSDGSLLPSASASSSAVWGGRNSSSPHATTTTAESMRYPHNNSPIRSSAVPLEFPSTATATATSTASAAAPGQLVGDVPMDSPVVSQLGTGSVFKRNRRDRLQTMEMVPLGNNKVVNLGRIAPNTVLATYITAGSLQDEVFHPETVVANSFVTAYTIGEIEAVVKIHFQSRVDNLLTSR